MFQSRHEASFLVVHTARRSLRGCAAGIEASKPFWTCGEECLKRRSQKPCERGTHPIATRARNTKPASGGARRRHNKRHCENGASVKNGGSSKSAKPSEWASVARLNIKPAVMSDCAGSVMPLTLAVEPREPGKMPIRMSDLKSPNSNDWRSAWQLVVNAARCRGTPGRPKSDWSGFVRNGRRRLVN